MPKDLPKIERSIEILAARDRVWEVISDLDNEPEYWYGTREVRNISRDGNVVNREIVQNFRKHRILQKVVLRPKDSIEIDYLKGLTEGKKTISIRSDSPDRQTVSVVWDARFAGVYKLLTPWLKKHTDQGTVSALERIKAAAEMPHSAIP
ncbi:MAG TPA: SRPBCC family protein [Nitrososphaerales archaeon]|nr:SRPBCC family protein [Nitrososphaerales archaeon]